MEFVYVVPRTVLFPDCYPHGFVPFSGVGAVDSGAFGALQGGGAAAAPFEALIQREGYFVERAYAERTPSLKQIIPYSIIECDGRVLLVRRTAKGGETRLHGKHSIGIGGHINPEDLGDAPRAQSSVLDAGSAREIAEELSVRGTYKVRRVGILNDDSNAVGAVHVGVVQVIHVTGTVDVLEREQLEGRLLPCEELIALHAQGANFETWSKMLLPQLGELLNLPIAAHS
ncbi:MAG: NUDIX hydrolase [Planctomycetes bacterium]|nr:NUDIX hydrolase [Planctomycetota bacterium]